MVDALVGREPLAPLAAKAGSLSTPQTQKLAKDIAILVYGTEYWKSVLDIDALIAHGAVSEKDRGLLHFADTPEEAFAFLQTALAKEVGTAPALDIQAGIAPSPQELLGPDIARTRG